MDQSAEKWPGCFLKHYDPSCDKEAAEVTQDNFLIYFFYFFLNLFSRDQRGVIKI